MQALMPIMEAEEEAVALVVLGQLVLLHLAAMAVIQLYKAPRRAIL